VTWEMAQAVLVGIAAGSMVGLSAVFFVKAMR